MAKKSKKVKKPEKKTKAAKAEKEEKPKIGRPTSYDPSFCEQIVKWFAHPYDSEKKCWNRQFKLQRMIDNAIIDADVPVYIPTLRDFAEHIGVSLQTIYNWIDDNDDFAVAYEEAMEAKMDTIDRYAFVGAINPTWAKYTCESRKPHVRKVKAVEKTEEEKEKSLDGYHFKITVKMPPELEKDLEEDSEEEKSGEGDANAGS